jgi:hypothetical protein
MSWWVSSSRSPLAAAIASAWLTIARASRSLRRSAASSAVRNSSVRRTSQISATVTCAVATAWSSEVDSTDPSIAATRALRPLPTSI